MVNVVTHVETSLLAQIGANIEKLSQLAPFTTHVRHRETLEAIRVSHSEAQLDDGQPAPGAREMAEIADGLAMSEIVEENGTWSLKLPPVGPNNAVGVQQLADVKFLFERANEKIIVIPHDGALEYAQQTPPLREADYATQIAAVGSVHQSPGLFDQLKTNVSDDWDAADPDIGAHKDKVDAVIDAAIEKILQTLNVEGTPPETQLYEQLGSYTCRQCG